MSAVEEDGDARFWSHVTKGDSCWEYTGARNTKGYGWITRSGRNIRAHRYAWELANGPIPDGMFVCHRCDNPPCVNIDHLYLGTMSDNMRDRANRSSYPGKKLGPMDAQKIRELRASGIGPASIGRMFGVRMSYVCDIVAGRYWK